MIQYAYTGNVISQNVTLGIIGIIGRNAMSSRGDLSIDWNPGIEIIIDELQDYLEMTDCLDEVAKEDHDDCTHLRIDNVYVNTIKYHYDYELNAITGSANVSYTVIIRFYEGDEFNGGLMDSDENYDDCANISFEAVIGDDMTDVRINDAEAF